MVPLKPVTLDGAADEESTGPAYEDTAWHAVWKDLPLYHPNGKNENGFTEYRVTETHTGDYVQVENQHEGNSYTFTNVPATQLRVVKTWYGTDLSNQKAVKVLLYRTTEGGTEEPGIRIRNNEPAVSSPERGQRLAGRLCKSPRLQCGWCGISILRKGDHHRRRTSGEHRV